MTNINSKIETVNLILLNNEIEENIKFTEIRVKYYIFLIKTLKK